jgi:hypothetical protein
MASGPNYAPYGEEYDGSSTNNSFTDQKQDTVSGGTGLYDFLYREYRQAQQRWIISSRLSIKVALLSHKRRFVGLPPATTRFYCRTCHFSAFC